MFTIEYVDSADPLIKIVKSDPGAVFDKPYMGYLLFLFGEADREATSWIREHLQALDSLTGPDIAGTVFVKSFEFEAHVEQVYTTRPGPSKIRNGQIDLRDVQYIDRPQFTARAVFDERRRIEPRAESRLESLKATTYATDEIARSLGLVAELPCIVFLDAIPREAKALRLDERSLREAIRIIRETLGHFMQAFGYAQQRDLLGKAHDLGRQIRRLRETLQDLDTSERAELRKVRTPLPRQLLEARKALLTGSARQFVHKLRATSLDKRTIDEAADRAKQSAESLTHLARTIRGISWYAEIAPGPITPDDLARISRIYQNHISPLLGVGPPMAIEIDRDVLASTLVELRTALRTKIEKIWGDFLIRTP